MLARNGRDPEAVVRAMGAAAPHRGKTVDSVCIDRTAVAVVRPHDGRTETAIGIADGLAIAFTGSFDNAPEFRAALGDDATDAEGPVDLVALLARAYRKYGAAMPARMRGVFAVVIGDGERLMAFRDHVGYRPLFHRLDSGGFAVASEAKQVVAGTKIVREPDLGVVEAIFFRTVDDDTSAALRGVRRLPKASVVTVSQAFDVLVRRYWDPASLLETARISDDELKDRFDALFDQAVNRALSGHDGISLSGGIDSPAIAAYAAPRHLERFGRPLQAISVVYPKYPSVDERPYIELVADRLAIPVHLHEQEANPLADMERWVALADTPYPGAALAQYDEDYRRAKAVGIDTLLTGEHAEFVVGMQWYTLDHFLTHRRFRAAWLQVRERRARGESPMAIMRLAARSIASDRVMTARNALGTRRRPATIPSWIDPRRVGADEPQPARLRWRESQLVGFTGPGISLEAEEICQAVNGVRSRKPWTDVDLWELFLRLPAEQKFPELRPKGLVRRLLRGRVPDEILDRTHKTVFDEAALAEIDYPRLERLLASTDHRLPGVDYSALDGMIQSRALQTIDYSWVRNLANAHAFLAQW